MNALTVLRRLAEQHSYSALRDACADADSADAGVLVLSALAAVGDGDARTARRILDALDRAPLDLDARVDLAAVHIALGEISVAIALLEADLTAQGDHAVLLARLAWCRARQCRCDEATALYERSLRSRPCIGAYHGLLRLHRDAGRVTEMSACLDAARRFWVDEAAEWPADRRAPHDRQLRCAQLELWLASERADAAECWLEQQRESLTEADWGVLLCDWVERLVARNRHAQAEEWLRSGLRQCPKEVVLIERLADLAEVQGRPRQAIALLERAIRLASVERRPTAALLIRLSTIALRFDVGVARHAIERARLEQGAADAGAEGSTEIELALAAVEAHDGQHAEAEDRYRLLLERWPDTSGAIEGLGRLFMQLGRIDEAAAMFERVETLDPMRGRAALISARRFPRDDDTLRRLERLARMPDKDGASRSYLMFQLVAAWEERGQYDRAFALAAEANTATRKRLRYDPKAHRSYCARIRHAYPLALYEHRADCGHESTLPVFVVGMPRSGTTLVEQILAGHSRTHGAGELGTIPRVIAGLERWERRTGSGRRYPDCVDDLDPHVVRGIAEGVLNELREYGCGADHVIDKLPHNFENIGLIRLLFPKAKIVSVRRDARDIAVSNYFTDYAGKYTGMGFAYSLPWIGEQLVDHDMLMRHWHRVFPGEILEVRYEELLDDTTAVARRMLEYVGVEWEPRLRQPLYSGARGRWRHYRQYLDPLLTAMNAEIQLEPIEMSTLPEPGLLNAGVDSYREGDLDVAEQRFKHLLHYLPEHASARFMLGVIYVRKGHRRDGIRLMEQAVDRCPWNQRWRNDLERARRSFHREATCA